MNLDALARATAQLDEASFLAKFPEPCLVFKPPSGDTNPGPDLETDRYPLPAPADAAQRARDAMGASVVLFLRSQKNDPVITLGRGREADIAIPLGNVSRIHALFTAMPGGGWSVTDNKSTNGTFVNDQKLASAATQELTDGMWLRFGADATVKFLTPLGLFGYLKMYRSTAG